jgi:uncharacterized protein YqeY
MQSKKTRLTPTVDVSLSTKERIRTDLRSAMRAGALLEVRALRALVAAIDNAQAVPVGDLHARYVVHRFGDSSAEVPRVRLTEDDIQTIIEKEMQLRHAAACELERCSKSEAASEAREEADILARYRTKV